jgi:hypothetical protein
VFKSFEGNNELEYIECQTLNISEIVVSPKRKMMTELNVSKKSKSEKKKRYKIHKREYGPTSIQSYKLSHFHSEPKIQIWIFKTHNYNKITLLNMYAVIFNKLTEHQWHATIYTYWV